MDTFKSIIAKLDQVKFIGFSEMNVKDIRKKFVGEKTDTARKLGVTDE